ncbi:MAG: glycoside hydrolase family 108 protein [Henriciella sp.]
MFASVSPAFQDALTEMLAHEGGFVNHPMDPGGMTNLGVTRRTYAKYKGVRTKDVSEETMRKLTVEDVAPIYASGYWLPVKADELPVGIGYMVFDFAVNSGPKRAVMRLQKSINHINRQGLTVDGKIGPKTLRAAGQVNVHDLITEYGARRMLFWAALSHFSTFRWGWFRRGASVIGQARAMADGTYRAGIALRH